MGSAHDSGVLKRERSKKAEFDKGKKAVTGEGEEVAVARESSDSSGGVTRE
jgi:hypothetical protein